MTLKESFEEVDRFTLMRESHNEKCVEIADDFAIGFTEWTYTNGKETIRKANEEGLKSTKELLEIYKKEKGL